MSKVYGLIKVPVVSVLLLACMTATAFSEKGQEEAPGKPSRQDPAMQTAPQGQAGQVASQEDVKKIDLNLTREYVRDWAARKAFPETVTFAYYCTYSLKALGEKIGPETGKKIVDYMKACQVKSGGFVTEPKFSKDATLLSTYFALKTLSLLDALKTIDQQKAAAFTLSLYQDDGSFKADLNKGYSSLATTYYGVTCLKLLGALDRIDKEKTVSYILSYREKNRGFSVRQKGVSRPISTYMAVRSLILLGALEEEIKPDLIKYLKETRYAGHMEEKKYTMQPTMRELAFVLEAFDDLSAVKEVHRDKVYGFIESLYVPENGGFGPKPSYGTTPPSIYEGIVCLEKLGRLKQVSGTK